MLKEWKLMKRKFVREITLFFEMLFSGQLDGAFDEKVDEADEVDE